MDRWWVEYEEARYRKSRNDLPSAKKHAEEALSQAYSDLGRGLSKCMLASIVLLEGDSVEAERLLVEAFTHLNNCAAPHERVAVALDKANLTALQTEAQRSVLPPNMMRVGGRQSDLPLVPVMQFLYLHKRDQEWQEEADSIVRSSIAPGGGMYQ